MHLVMLFDGSLSVRQSQNRREGHSVLAGGGGRPACLRPWSENRHCTDKTKRFGKISR